MSDPTDVPRVAARQGGVFTAAQARAEGWSARQVRRRIVAGRWVQVAGRGLAVPAQGWTAFQLGVAASLTWPGCVVSHRTAAVLHGLPLPDAAGGVAEVITGRGRASSNGLVAHATRIGDEEIVSRGPIRLTSPRRTATDCLASLPQDAALDLWAWLTTRKIVDVHDLRTAIAARRFCTGTPRLVTIERIVAGGAVNLAELAVHRLLEDAGITGWEGGVTVTDAGGVIGDVDILFHRAKLIIEIDGYGAHSSRVAFVVDRRRQNRLVVAGYTVLRFTWDDIRHRPATVLAAIRAALDLQGA